MAIASLAIGIIFILAILASTSGVSFFGPGLSLIGSVVIALPAGIVGLVLGIIGLLRRKKPRIAISGTVLNALIVAWFLILLLAYGILGD